MQPLFVMEDAAVEIGDQWCLGFRKVLPARPGASDGERENGPPPRKGKQAVSIETLRDHDRLSDVDLAKTS